ncbi:MAG: helix-turn-helix transcriptional regulator [Candidatus Margulisiibacteriota bacterium]
MAILNGLGKKIKMLRNARGLTQEDLDGLTGLHYTFIAKIEAGKKQPSLKSLAKIAKALGISLSRLFEEKQKVPIKPPLNKLIKILEDRDPKEVNLIIELAETIFSKADKLLKQKGSRQKSGGGGGGGGGIRLRYNGKE